MKKFLLLFKVVLLCCISLFSSAQSVKKVVLNPIEKSLKEIMSYGTPQIKANEYKIYQIDFDALKNQMDGVGHIDDNTSGFVAAIRIPLADGSMHEFLSKENNTMARELAANFPKIKTFDGIGSVSGEIANWDITPHGFHAMIYIPGKGTVFIDPVIKGNTEFYIVYNKNDFTTDKIMDCGLIDEISNTPSYSVKAGSCELRTYRLALAATGEYTAFHGGTVAGALAAQVTTMNRVNGLYERDIAIRMTIIGNNNLIIYTNAGTDPYTNNNGATMLGQNQTTCDAVIGNANYDIGHVFSTGGGGIAQLYSPCSTNNKARGVTGSSAPVGDPFDIDYVAHEMGHQFGGNHTQNNNCNRNNATAVEPGSASTIMGYAGICAPNVQNNSNDYFHGVTLQEIGTFITGGGHTCPVKTPLSNNSPSVTLSSSAISIPVSTPFFLTANGSDADPSNVLTYDWEQMDNQTSTQPPVATATGGPNFRSYSPTTNQTRYFPNLTSLSANGPFTWEVLPSVARTMNFRVTVRDNSSGGGCNEQTNMTVSTIAGIGPFVVTYPNNTGITWVGATTQTVTWTVAGTTAAPVSCANVDILLSTDGGLTYPTVLVSNTPNDGSQLINVPNLPSTTCRVMAVCNGGNFFDISNNNFTITAATNDYTLNTAPTSISICQGSNAVYTVNTGSIGGYSSNITLSVTGVPAGATSNFSVNPVAPGSASTLTISNTAGVTPGSYNLTVTANSASGVKTNNLILIVSSGTPGAVTLTAPANGATGVAIPANFTWSAATGSGVTYDIQIATDAGISSIVDQATGLSTTSFSSSLLNNSTTYYWRVRSVTGCGTSAWSTIYSFTTGTCSTTISPNVPVAISASGTPTITSTINITSSIIIADINLIDIIGTHTYVSDLTVTLTSPSATTITLWSGICTTDDNFNLNFDDAAVAGAIPCPPTGGGTFQPVNALSVFNGEDAQGVWTLTISDAFDVDGGALDSWGLEICGTACTPPTTPTTTASGPTTFCSGGSVTLNSSSATGNQWNLNGTPIVGATNQTYAATATGNYTVTFTSGGCSSAPSIATSVTVNTTPTPTISASGATSFCNGGSVTLTSSSSTGNQWNLNGAPIGGATNQTYVASVTGNYSVTVTSAGCTSAPSIATSVTVNTAPSSVSQTSPANGSTGVSTPTTFNWVASAEPGVTYSIDISTDAAFSIIVDQATGLSTTTFNSTVLSPGTIYYWRVRVTNTCGNSNWSGNYSFTTGACVITASTNVPIIISASGTPTITSTLTFPSSVTIADVNVVNLAGTHDNVGDLTVTLTSPLGTTTTLWSNVCPNNRDFNLNFDDGAATATLPCPPTGGGTYQPSGSLASFNGENAAGIWTLTVIDGSNPKGGALNSWGLEICGTSCVPPSTPTVTASGATTFCNGGSVTLTSSSATGNQWSLNGTPIGGATNSTYVVSATGTYTVIVTSGGCSSVSSGGTNVTVNPIPSTPTVTASGPTTFCDGGSVTLTSISATGNQWYNGGTLIGGATAQTYSAATTGSYTVIVTTSGCPSTASAATSVTVNPAPTITVGTITNPSACATSTGSIQVNGSATGIVSWTGTASGTSGSVTLPYVITGLAAGSYNISITASGCPSNTLVQGLTDPSAPASPTISAGGALSFCSGGSVTLTSSSSTGNQWSLNGTPIGGGTNQTYTASASGDYTVVTISGGCTSAASAATTVTVNPIPVITLGTVTNPSLCATANGSIQVNGSSTGIVSWTGASSGNSGTVTLPYLITGLAAGSYNISINSGSCPSNTLVQSLSGASAPPAPTITNSGANAFCAGGSISLTSSAASGNQWFLNGSPILGATGQTYVATTSGDYTVTETSGTCTSSSSALTTLTVNPNPTAPIVTTSGSTAICAGSSVTLTSSQPTGNLWSNGQSTANTTVTTAGIYTVTYTDLNGCSATTSGVEVTINPLPSAPIITAGGPLTFCEGGSVNLTSSYSSGNVWSTNAPTNTITVNTAGSYSVTHTNANGCSASSAATTVVVNALPTVNFASMGTLCEYYSPSNIVGGTPAGGVYSGTGVTAGQFDPSAAGFGNHTLTYTFTDGNGCVNNATSDVLVDDCASIDELAGNNINLFPNPTFGLVNIVSESKSIDNIKIFDAAGRMVMQLNGNNSNSIAIDMIEFANGVYNFEIEIEETIRRERIIKN